MKALIKKDLLNLSSYKVSIIITTVFCIFAIASTTSLSLVPLVMCSILGMISLSSFNYDEASKAEKYILSMPVSRKEIVASKYLLALLSIIIGTLTGALLSIIVTNIMNVINPSELTHLNYEELFVSSLGGMFGIAFIQSLQIPCVYKWGAEKGRINMFIIFFVIVLIVSGLVFLLSKTAININFTNIINIFNSYAPYILTVLIIIMYSASYKISYKIFMKNDY